MEKKDQDLITPSDKKIGIFDLLLQIPVFDNLSQHLIHLLNNKFITKTFHCNEYIIKQNEPINKIYIVRSGSFTLYLNHNKNYIVNNGIETFIRYQNITKEPFNSFRSHEIKGVIEKKELIPLIILQQSQIFGDIELLMNSDKSIFSLKANEENASLCIINRNYFYEVVKQKLEIFSEFVKNKIDMLNIRLKEILLKERKLNVDEFKLKKSKIFFQVEVNHAFNTISCKIKKNLSQKNMPVSLKNKFPKINSSELKTPVSKEELINKFKFPNIIKNDPQKYLNDYESSKKSNKYKVKLLKTSLDFNKVFNKDDLSQEKKYNSLSKKSSMKTNQRLNIKQLTEKYKKSKKANNSSSMIKILKRNSVINNEPNKENVSSKTVIKTLYNYYKKFNINELIQYQQEICLEQKNKELNGITNEKSEIGKKLIMNKDNSELKKENSIREKRVSLGRIEFSRNSKKQLSKRLAVSSGVISNEILKENNLKRKLIDSLMEKRHNSIKAKFLFKLGH